MYEIQLSLQAKKFLKKLNAKERRRIYAVLERVRIRPHHYAKKLVASDYFRIRVGTLRLIVDIKDGELIVLVVEIGERRNIYK